MKKTLIYVIEIIILLLVATSVIAASKSDIVRANLISSKEELKSEQEVVVTLKFDKYSKDTQGINCFKAVLDYDKKIFEKVVQANFRTKNNWEELKYNQETGEIVVIKKLGSKTDEEIAEITLRVKEEIEAGKTEITLGRITTSEGKEDLIIDDAKVGIDIIKEQETDPNLITSKKYKIGEKYITRIVPETTVEEFRGNVITNEEMVFTDGLGNVIGEKEIIKTGTKLKVGNEKEYILIVIGDIDKDGIININDLARIRLHLIDLKLLTGIELYAADVDNDNDVTINDIAQMKLILIDLLKLEK